MNEQPDFEIDEFSGRLKVAELRQNSLVYNPLNHKLLYTKPEIDSKIANATGVKTIVAGTNITVDNTDPSNPIVSSSGGAGSGITRTVQSKSTNFSVAATASVDFVYFVSGTTTATMPTAVGNTNRYTIKNTGSGVVTIATTSAQAIDGSSSANLSVQNTSLDLVSDGSNWQIT